MSETKKTTKTRTVISINPRQEVLRFAHEQAREDANENAEQDYYDWYRQQLQGYLEDAEWCQEVAGAPALTLTEEELDAEVREGTENLCITNIPKARKQQKEK